MDSANNSAQNAVPSELLSLFTDLVNTVSNLTLAVKVLQAKAATPEPAPYYSPERWAELTGDSVKGIKDQLRKRKLAPYTHTDDKGAKQYVYAAKIWQNVANDLGVPVKQLMG